MLFNIKGIIKDTLIRPSGTFSRKREKGKPGDIASLKDKAAALRVYA